MKTLHELANFYGTDKGSLHSAHMYTEIYDRLMGPHKDLPIHLVEIGINNPGFNYASIRMWSEFFPNGTISGLDINIDKGLEDLAKELGNVSLYLVDQTNSHQLKAFAGSVPAFDFVIDDGAHTHISQITSFLSLFPHVKEGGIYFIEDCNALDCYSTIKDFKDKFHQPSARTEHRIKDIKFYNNNKLIVIVKDSSPEVPVESVVAEVPVELVPEILPVEVVQEISFPFKPVEEVLVEMPLDESVSPDLPDSV